MRLILRVGVAGVLVVGLAAGLLKLRYGGGAAFPDRSGDPQWPDSRLEVVAELDMPPGNITVSADGRVFATFHPEARPDVSLIEIVAGEALPYPNRALQPSGDDPRRIRDVLSIRADGHGRLWALDNGFHGLQPGRLLGFDLASGELAVVHELPRSVAGRGSHLNDFQISPDGATLYIADASFFAQDPAIIVVDAASGAARRVVYDHESVDAERYLPVVQGRQMEAFGLVAIRPGVDSIGLGPDGQWLYFAPVTNNYLYRIRTRDLTDASLSAEGVRARIRRVGLKTMSDGIAVGPGGDVYLTDLEHSAIVRMAPDGSLTTLLKTPRLRWPDGLALTPGGQLYITCSSLQHVIGLPPSSVEAHAPYQIFRVNLAAE